MGDRLQYPEVVSISCREPPPGLWPGVLGVYERTERTHSGRPVWRNRDKEDRYLFYNSKQTLLWSEGELIFEGDASQWLIHRELGDFAYLQSKARGETYLPVKVWQYRPYWSDDWLDIAGLTVKGITGDIRHQISPSLAEGSPHYPHLLRVGSSGPVADLLPSYLGLYQRLVNVSHSARPVWGHAERGDRFLLFQGRVYYCQRLCLMTGAGDGFWYISQEISNTGGELGSRRKDEVAVPETDWDYKLDGKWLEDDNTLTVSAQNRSEIQFL